MDRFQGNKTYVITSFDYAHLVQNHVKDVELIIEPKSKNTGPAIVFALKELMQQGKINENDVVMISPADQFLSPKENLKEAMDVAKKAAEKGFIVTFGLKPTKAETGFGYVVTEEATGVLRTVKSFEEKPSKEVAEQYLLDPQCFWNSGMFVFQVGMFFKEVAKYAPALLLEFSRTPSVSIDTALFEKSDHVALVPLNVEWSDMGSWDSVYDVLEKDCNHNVHVGNVYSMDTERSFIFSNKRLVTTNGVKDLVVVETEDALYIGKRGESQQVKQIVDKLTRKTMRESHEHRTIHRPWGTFTVLEEGTNFKIKKIAVQSNAALSLQRHRQRSEHWVVTSGQATVTLGEQELELAPNQSVFVPIGMLHRLANMGEEPLEIIEVQVGTYLGEDDIERFEDVYGRHLVASK